jgi:hypothetical protein
MKAVFNWLKKRQTIFYIVCFCLFLLSFYTNVFKIIPESDYKGYETFCEALVVGKMAKAEKDGIFAASGFTGVNYDKALVADSILKGDQINDLLIRDHIITQFKFSQLAYFLGKEKTPNDYCPYVSHSGGNALFWYGIEKILPFDGYTNYQLLRLINCILLAMCFMLFIGWIYRNFSFVPALVTFLLIFFSSWPVFFCGNGLWWVLWNFYAPFLTMLLLLEKRHNSPDKASTRKILVWLFIAVLIKLFFSGMEFISTAMLMLFIPIVYYAILERWKISNFIKLSFKSGLTAGVAIIIQFGTLIIQLRYLLGNYDSAFRYLSDTFLRRASFKSGLSGADLDSHRFADSDSLSFLWNNVIKDYLRGNVFEWGFMSLGFNFWFAVLIGIILFSGAVVCLFSPRSRNNKYNALVFSTLISVVCPLSWYAIFKEHAFWHPQIDYIVWYMPFFLLGFAVIGIIVSLLILKIPSKR